VQIYCFIFILQIFYRIIFFEYSSNTCHYRRLPRFILRVKQHFDAIMPVSPIDLLGANNIIGHHLCRISSKMVVDVLNYGYPAAKTAESKQNPARYPAGGLQNGVFVDIRQRKSKKKK
jgi:hypothetical protein